MADLAVIGNTSIDHTCYPDGAHRTLIGGAALHIARAAADAGASPVPVTVLGHDLADLPSDPRFSALDWSGAVTVQRPSARFTLTYDASGRLADVEPDYQAAHTLTAHAQTWLASHPDLPVHVCCRAPLDTAAVLSLLAGRATPFSLDFYAPSARRMLDAARPYLPAAAAIMLNREEASLLTLHTPHRALQALVITDGPGPARIYRRGELTAEAVPRAVAAVELTGAGDTLTGALLANLLRGLPDQAALERAVSAATAHIQGDPLYLAL